MTDRLTPEQRHRCMSHIRSRNTKPELKVRQWLWKHNYRYRLNVKSVPGKPDIVMRKYRTAIFVNGCFWHGHHAEVKTENGKLTVKNSACCKIPQSNLEYWTNKIRRNQERDARNCQLLQENGWQVIVVWECQLTSERMEQTMRRVEIMLNENFLRLCRLKASRYLLASEELPAAAEPETEYHASKGE